MRDGGSDKAKGVGLSDAFLLFGSNVGDRYGNIDRGIGALEGRGIRWEAISSYYETEPTDLEGQPWFINLVARGKTAASPEVLLRLCKDVERDAGRIVDAPRFSPRVLDIDILLYEELQVDTPDLVIPHPRMSERRFVLIPLIEIAPYTVDPRTGRRFAEILSGLDEEKKVTKSKRRRYSSR
jgi:2-amino-4-hydroxy-6-hydroxymethyldihydropteridine diphosphokinase